MKLLTHATIFVVSHAKFGVKEGIAVALQDEATPAMHNASRAGSNLVPTLKTLCGSMLTDSELRSGVPNLWDLPAKRQPLPVPPASPLQSLKLPDDVRAATFARLWPGKKNTLRWVNVSDEKVSASRRELHPGTVTFKTSLATVQNAGMATCSITRDSYRCTGPKYEQYLRKHIAPGAPPHAGNAAARLPSDTSILFLGDSHTRQVAAAMLCEFQCPNVVSDEDLFFLSGYWPKTNTRLVSISNPHNYDQMCHDCGPSPTNLDYNVLEQELGKALSPLLSSGTHTVVVQGNLLWYHAKPAAKSAVYLPTARGLSILKRLWPASTIINLFSWSVNFPAYGVGRIPQLQNWCAKASNCCVKATNLPPCAADFFNCNGARNQHQCLPGLPNLLARKLLHAIKLGSVN